MKSIGTSNKGFSLMELVVVMAIMTIITMIAAPGFRAYKARALQKEGFSLMNEYYQHAQTARAEYGLFPGNFVGTRFQPHGTLTYRVRIENNPNSQGRLVDPAAIQPIDNDTGCIATWSDCNCGTGCTKYEKSWVELPAGITGSRTGPQTVLLNCPPLAVAGASDNNFSVRVSGVISTSATGIDRYGMDETKQIIMCEDGLN